MDSTRCTHTAERATKEYPLRSNTVHPLLRKNTHTNTGQGIPHIKIDFVPDSDKIEIWMAPKGSGSENMSFLRMLKPSDGVKGVKKFVLECVFESGANPCPPVILGIGSVTGIEIFAALWMVGMTAVAVALGFGGGLTRREGAAIVALYVAFAVVLATS